MPADLATWLPKSETAARLGISERTLDRLVTAGKGPECRKRQRPGRKPEPVYNPADVDALASAAERPAVFNALSPIGPKPPISQNCYTEGDIPPGLAAVLGLMEGLVRIAQRPLLEAFRAPQTLWVTIPQASEYTGLSEALLRRLVADGILAGVRDRALKVRRVDLDNLDTLSPLAKSVGGGL